MQHIHYKHAGYVEYSTLYLASRLCSILPLIAIVLLPIDEDWTGVLLHETVHALQKALSCQNAAISAISGALLCTGIVF